MLRLAFASAIMFSSVGSTARSGEYDTTLLFERGAWAVEQTHDATDDKTWCSAETVNGASQVFSVVIYPDGGARVFVMDLGWSLSERPIMFRIDVDYDRWDVNGLAKDISVSVGLDDAETSIDFLTDLMEGSAVAVYNQDDRRLATFSLAGSSAAMLKLVECWELIEDRDPFQSGSDPFVGVSDPF